MSDETPQRPGNVNPPDIEQCDLGLAAGEFIKIAHGLEADAGFAADIEFLKAGMEPADVRARIEEYDGHAEVERVVKADLANAQAMWSGLRESLEKAQNGLSRAFLIALLVAAFVAGFGVALILIGALS